LTESSGAWTPFDALFNIDQYPIAFPVPVPADPQAKPTVEEAKAAQTHSSAYTNMMRVCGGLVYLVKRIEPCLKGTPLETPVAVFTTIADIAEVRMFTVA
jgi:hypothetical protein